MAEYDAILLVSFGGPERPEDVMPFLENVVRGRDVPRARLEAVAEHYFALGGRSPINDQNRALIAALGEELTAHGFSLPIYFGNRNWHPLLADTVSEMTRAGVRRALALITSAYSSYSGCRQYREDIERARASVPGAPVIDPIRRFFNHPGFLEACLARFQATWREIPQPRRAAAYVLYSAHSIPLGMAERCDYEAQLLENGRWLSAELGHDAWELVWQSRSGPTTTPWLEPDVLVRLRGLAASGVRDVVIFPIGFVSDHMEVVHDLDVEARAVCDELGLTLHRVPTVGTHPRFVSGLRELIAERLAGGERRHLGVLPPRGDVCAETCCPRGARPSPPA